MLDFGFQGF